MRLIVTGGGTGGHVYPALEVARTAAERGYELLYLGSNRGQEGKLCEARGFLFKGFPSEPLWSLKTLKGWKALSRLIKARRLAKRYVAASKADIIFSTGGYSAAPILSAARSLKVPYVIHESNSVPGRTNRMFGKAASAFLSVFRTTERFYTDRPVLRVGQPIRKELRTAAARDRIEDSVLLVLGGSQGSAYLNEAVPVAVKESGFGGRVIHASGPNHFAETQARVKGLGLNHYEVSPYLETEEITAAYCQARLVVCRSGGTLAELALFRLPSVLVPLPTSADQHQLHNAKEFENLGAASVTEQEKEPFPATAAAISHWWNDESARNSAAEKLGEWDIPDATERILGQIEAAAR